MCKFLSLLHDGEVLTKEAGTMVRRHMRAGLACSLLITSMLLGTIGCAQTNRAPERLHGRTDTTSALIFGTNLSLYDTNDQVVNNLATQRLLKQAHLPIIRMPFRASLSDIYEVRALRAIQYIGAIPLVIMLGPTEPNALVDDRRLIALVQHVFGNATVYVEFGNESDLAGVDVIRYTQAWNQVIPSLKSIAPLYRFVGPATWNANPAYIAAFDANANPRPDANSWHEYVCAPRDPDEYCMSRVASWATHVQEINTAVRAAIGTTLPLMLTEWNLDAAPDPRYANASFIQAWTANALQTLADNMPNGLLAAMQYCVANNATFQLIDSANQLTLEGRTFFQVAQRAGSRAP